VPLYTPFLFGCGLKFGLVEGDAKDVVQEFFLLLFDKLPQFHRIEGGSFRDWLKTVMLNKCREIHRQRHETAIGGSGAGLSGIADDGSVDLLWDCEYRQSLIARVFEVMRDEFEPNIRLISLTPPGQRTCATERHFVKAKTGSRSGW
jgi:DNA-directed RNA polymerase specialized sigma24 family protein